MKDVVIVCINGWNGGGPFGGMVTLKEELQEKLAPLGVPSNNIFRRSWNHGGDNDTTGTPDVGDLLREIGSRTENPSYLAIIGHSFGGWAACQLSQKTNRIPDFVGLFDPVFGIENVIKDRDKPRGLNIQNWFQHNSITYEPCSGVKIPCSKPYDGFSCGHSNVTDAQNHRERYEKWESGRVKEVECTILPGVKIKRKVLTSHMAMDSNPILHERVKNIIHDDLRKMIVLSQQLQIITALINRQY
ncbi:hypothetical protein COM38_26895 [Bacillus toyonensis]|uniref:hypothetical protein n=1 Tax=Bacillus toyonensis TaxID=155322 RepID=UPI000BECD044|nr:hypothetical protein [Bacillus toyonensis]PEC07530.1 hypothetical protein CON55_28605 [Bacillus toyonensis]PGD49321.1 hypothetical protein COM38_26895 [Bacillus toyonensis]